MADGAGGAGGAEVGAGEGTAVEALTGTTVGASVGLAAVAIAAGSTVGVEGTDVLVDAAGATVGVSGTTVAGTLSTLAATARELEAGSAVMVGADRGGVGSVFVQAATSSPAAQQIAAADSEPPESLGTRRPMEATVCSENSVL